MISIVLVSHSRKIAEGVLGLLRQVTPPGVKIAQASGVGPDYGEIGTDAVHIAEVIQAVYSPDGVLVLMDLGSAVLSAETALEFLPEEMRAKVSFCPAPFVEGAVTAGVQAGLGSDLETACRESQNALAAKTAQLSTPAAHPSEQGHATNPVSGAESCELVVTIRNPHGLHLRPAAQFVQVAARFRAEISVWNQSSGSGPVSAKSINALAMLNTRPGDEVKIFASGPEAQAAIQALRALVEQNFGEASEESAPAPLEEQSIPIQDASPGTRRGIPISAGVATAPLHHLKRELITVENDQAENPAMEWQRLEKALGRVKERLKKRQAEVEQRLGMEKAGIFGALAILLEDPELIQLLRPHIFEQGSSAAAAWAEEIGHLKDRYLGLEDAYLKQRAVDIEDVGRQVLAELSGRSNKVEIPGSVPVILYADELTPSETAQLNLDRVAGLITARGGVTSHSAILARALGIPAVSGIDLSINAIPDGTLLILDGDQGQVVIEPSTDVQTRYKRRKLALTVEIKAAQLNSQRPALLKNGRRVLVMANIGSLEEAKQAAAQGADGVGLLRTEFLFLSRAQAPGEDEQVTALRAVGQAVKGRPVIVRTLDVGGDKPLPYLPAPEEANPFLGVRAIRLTLRHPELFQVQLRAILRAANDYPLRVMFPMIATMRDLQQAKEQLEAAHLRLSKEQVPHRWPIETGIMVEIPSAALLSNQLAPLVDFFSIGTNDLTQYTLAADRGSPALAEYADALHPAVLNLIQQVVKSAKRCGKTVGICGELAGDPLAVAVLVGLGLDELSLSPAAVPRIKEIIRGLQEESAIRLAEKVLQLDSAADVRKAVQDTLNQL